MDYLGRLLSTNSELKLQFEKGLTVLEALSRNVFGGDFPSLNPDQRVAVLQELEERADRQFFALLRDRVYEAYYTRPEVWKLVGYVDHVTDGPGTSLPPLNEALLTRVRSLPPLYRRVE
jgi:hypothetical protein